MAQYSKLVENEIQEIAGRYKLEITGYEPIEQGASNSNYMLSTKRNQYILTILEFEPARAAKMSSVLLLLAEYEFPAPRIHKLANGEVLTKYRGKPVLLKPYLTGQVIKDLDEHKVRQVGAALARLHEIPAPDYLPDRNAYLVETYPAVLAKGIAPEYKNWLRQRHDSLVQDIPAGLPIGLVHGDIFYDNILFDEGKFKAILDFEDVCKTFKVYDLGMAAVGVCTDDTKIVLRKVRALVEGYQQVRLLQEKEKQSLRSFVEFAAVLTSAWRFWKYHIDAPDAGKSERHMQMVDIAKDACAIPTTLFMNTVFSG